MKLETKVVHVGDPSWLEAAMAALQGGGLVAFPTETVYGVGALAFDGEAISGIYRAKGRSTNKAIPVLVSGRVHLRRVAVLDGSAERLAATFWPGPLTLVVPREQAVPPAIGPGDTVGVRAPDHRIALELLRSAGPLAASSANRSKGKSPRTAAEVVKALAGRIAVIIDGGTCPGGLPSTVVDCTGPEPVLLREGPISLERIRSVWFGG
jgi:L-threonylcarbamoyladenylate synthase